MNTREAYRYTYSYLRRRKSALYEPVLLNSLVPDANVIRAAITSRNARFYPVADPILSIDTRWLAGWYPAAAKSHIIQQYRFMSDFHLSRVGRL